MARSNAVWGIDIGQCALKALRCRPHDDDPSKITADAFDYIEYPKILSQPDAEPADLVREAITQFLSRNSVRGDRVAISVSGQSGLARFIKLPPVESKKIPDIVKYEARQQIPFALEDVIWDYQQMAGGSETDGFAMETEVGLFAMKRDQVHRALTPFDDAGIEVDIIQLTPLAIYNYTVFDQMQHLPPPDEYDPDNPPESVVVLSLGTDTTDLVVTNGYRVWQRSVPLGGSHFTKALTKELRLTFAKAEHLKRNATQADDPKAVFQAMRPVFNDLLTEVQRSIGFFTGIDRKAKIGRVVALGNAMKLPGLQKYLSQNLGYPVADVEAYRGLTGSGVVSAPIFKENLLSFGVCYGLTLQALGKGTLRTNLLPREIVTERLIRAKKPWAVAAAALLLLGCSISFAGHWLAWSVASDPKYTPAFSAADGVAGKHSENTTKFKTAQDNFQLVSDMGQRIVGNVEGRLLWLEVLKAINESLPRDPEDQRPESIEDRNEIHIEEIECEFFPDIATWYANAKPVIDVEKGITTAADGTEATPAAATDSAQPADAAAPPAEDATPTGEGWVIQVTAHHFHNKRGDLQGAQYVREKFMKNLEEGSVELADKSGKMELVAIKELGIMHPVLVETGKLYDHPIPTGKEEPAKLKDPANPAQGYNPPEQEMINVKKFDFVMQFIWIETPRSKRLEKKLERERAAASAAPDATAPADAAPGST